MTAATRQAIWFTIATWTMSGLLYLGPYFLFDGAAGLRADRQSDAYVLLTVINICVGGSLLSGGVFLIARAVRHRGMPLRLATMVAAVAAGAALLALWDVAVSGWLGALMDLGQRWVPVLYRATNNFVALVWQFALLAAVYTVLEANEVTRARDLELAAAREMASRADAAASAARLAALRYQLHPHFLFNTLNAISSLIVTRAYDEADAMLARLSEFLRATLAADPEGVVPLEDELATIEHYLEIEGIRFEDRLAVDFACPPELLDALVPSFILQPLVENSIKYAVSPSSRRVTLHLEAIRDGDDLVLMVEDDGDPLPPDEARGGTGVGLANIRHRLAALYGDRGSLEAVRRERGFIAVVRLPFERQSDKRNICVGRPA